MSIISFSDVENWFDLKGGKSVVVPREAVVVNDSSFSSFEFTINISVTFSEPRSNNFSSSPVLDSGLRTVAVSKDSVKDDSVFSSIGFLVTIPASSSGLSSSYEEMGTCKIGELGFGMSNAVTGFCGFGGPYSWLGTCGFGGP